VANNVNFDIRLAMNFIQDQVRIVIKYLKKWGGVEGEVSLLICVLRNFNIILPVTKNLQKFLKFQCCLERPCLP